MTFFRTHVFVVLCLVCGAVAGLGLYTFTYAQGFSYFSHDPKACANCHVMNDYYDSWTKSSHHNAGGCIECHMPEGNFAKLVAKSDNGYRHSKGFTFMDFHEPIQITPRNVEILQENCVRCHSQLTHGMSGDLGEANQMTCIHCHSHVGHR
ncbi:MAG: cytochrome c nitrite reductase small subunit [Planctomycetota bacterium]